MATPSGINQCSAHETPMIQALERTIPGFEVSATRGSEIRLKRFPGGGLDRGHIGGN